MPHGGKLSQMIRQNRTFLQKDLTLIFRKKISSFLLKP